MTALKFSAWNLLRSATSSFFCSSVDSPRFDGQSMLATVATHTPRNSRFTVGGSAARGRDGNNRRARTTRSRGIVGNHSGRGKTTRGNIYHTGRGGETNEHAVAADPTRGRLPRLGREA